MISHDFIVVDITLSVFMLLAIICVVLRFLHRCTPGGMNIGWDDWTILAGFVFALGGFVILIRLSLLNIGIGAYHVKFSVDLGRYTLDNVSK